MTRKELKGRLQEVERYAIQAKQEADEICFQTGCNLDILYDTLNELQGAEISADEAFRKLEEYGELKEMVDD